jgi:TRAP-type mannitol/chloroaromatic compound transport system permease large subunit
MAHRAARPHHPPRVATIVPYLAVLVLVAGGVYISWHQGSHGGGMGGVIAGAAFLIAAAVRLALPEQFAGLLASRNRVTDVVTLVIFGACLLVLGLVLPRLGPF